MSEPPAGGPLSDQELRLLIGLIRRFCDHEMDQFELWRLSTVYGPAYIDIKKHPSPGAIYDDLDAWLASRPE